MMSPAREVLVNRNMLNRELALAKELDRYIAWWEREKGEKPKSITITKAQMAKLQKHAVEGASVDNWNGVAFKVQG
jgi:hypothetical protein